MAYMDSQQYMSRLRHYIATESAELHRTLRFYLMRAGFGAHTQTLDSATSELVNEVVVEALTHEARFRSEMHPRAWLLGIAANLIKRRQTELARQQRREPLIRDLYPGLEDVMSDDDLFDLMIEWADSGQVDGRDSDDLLAVLDTLPPNDSHILRLALLNGLNGDMLAQELGISPGAARVRLHRALQRLRSAYQTQEAQHDNA
jgi:RNA polymerase sigma factor (sigma-70 family)